MIIDVNDLGPASAYKLLIATIAPKAIGWVSAARSGRSRTPVRSIGMCHRS